MRADDTSGTTEAAAPSAPPATSAPPASPAPRLILASSSPRRLEMLQAHGHAPEVIAPSVDENLDKNASLAELPPLLEALASAKARSVAAGLAAGGAAAGGAASDPAIVIAADTVVYADGLLGKPADHDQAVATLLALRGRSHTVLTAVAVIWLPGGAEQAFTDTAEVLFADYSLEDIEAYIAAEPPYDKAGSYAIQGLWGQHVAEVKGDIDTVIGLPYRRLAELLGW